MFVSNNLDQYCAKHTVGLSSLKAFALLALGVGEIEEGALERKSEISWSVVGGGRRVLLEGHSEEDKSARITVPE